MWGSFLMGIVAGSRSLTPLAAVSRAASRGALPADNGAPAWLARPHVATGLRLLAAGERFGDKLPSAPDRIVLPGMIARVASGGLAGAAHAPRSRAWAGAAVGALTAVGAAYVTYRLRIAAMERFGQTASGLVEDALAVGVTQRVLSDSTRRPELKAP